MLRGCGDRGSSEEGRPDFTADDGDLLYDDRTHKLHDDEGGACDIADSVDTGAE